MGRGGAGCGGLWRAVEGRAWRGGAGGGRFGSVSPSLFRSPPVTSGLRSDRFRLSLSDLLRQHRVKLHINFFTSLALNGSVTILWYMLVHHDLLTTPSTEAVMNLNPVSTA